MSMRTKMADGVVVVVELTDGEMCSSLPRA